MAATLTRDTLPISEAQAEAAVAVVEAVCREFGIVAEIVVKPTLDPELPPYRMALVEVQVSEDLPPDRYRLLVPAVGRALKTAGLQWPARPITMVVW